jgi:hypothetical protein
MIIVTPEIYGKLMQGDDNSDFRNLWKANAG